LRSIGPRLSPRHLRVALAGLALLCVSWAPPAALAEPPPTVEPSKPLAPHLLLIHGGSFVHDDLSFEALTRGPAEAAGFVPHYLAYPLGDLAGAVLAARAEARRLGERFPGRLYAYGTSAGGTLAAILAGDGLVRAAAAKAPVSDLLTWEWPLTAYGPDFFEAIGADESARRRLSPLRRPARRPLLVLQGRADAVVPAAMNEAFAAKFARVHLWLVAGGHATERLRPRLLEGAFAWLAAYAERPKQASL
jgi:acetyl esterase/lipase